MKKFRLDGVVGWDIMADSVSAYLDSTDDAHFIINSGGGDVLEGFAIYNAIKAFKGSVTMEIDFAASMASVIAMAGTRVIMKESSSIMMIHRPWGMSGGNSEDLRRQADTLDKMEVMLIDLYVSKSGMDRDILSQLLADETYLDAAEALSYGLIDEVESGKQDFAMVAMSGMKASKKVDFDTSKLVAKIESMKASKKPVRDTFKGCETLAKVESVMRQEFKLSQSEATAIVAAVRKIDRGDHDQKSIVNELTNFKFSF